jgi:predicted nucleic acid-binding protein
MNCTVDASVFVAAARREETHHAASRRFLREARARGTTLVCPVLALPECAAAMARPTGQSSGAEKLVRLIQRFRGLRLVAVELPLARRAAELATAHRLRGADSAYVAVAEAVQATLITWDAEMLERSPAAVPTVTPTEWVARQNTGPMEPA